MNKLKNFYSILTTEQKNQFLFLVILTFIGMLLEMFSFGLIIPAVNILLQYEDTNYVIINHYLTYLPKEFNEFHFFVIGLTIILLAFMIKSLFLVFVSWFTMKFVFFIQRDTSHRLFSGYLSKPYKFFTESNSSEMIKNVTHECANLVSVVLSALYLFAEGTVIFGLSALLIYYQPIAALSVILFLGTLSIIFYFVIRNFNLNWGKKREKYENNRLKRIQQGIGAIQEVKVLNREKDFINLFNIENVGLTHVSKSQNFVLSLPRFFLEFAGILGLCILITILIINGTANASIITNLAIFGAVAFRVIPSINRCLGAMSQIRYYHPSIDIIYNETSKLDESIKFENFENKLSFNNSLEFLNISFNYDNANSFKAIEDISIQINKGESLGIVGESGSGKSTFINLLLGLLKPTNGKIKVDNCDINENIQAWRNNIGFVPQNIYLIDDTIRRNIALGVPDDEINEDKINKALSLSQMSEFINNLKTGLDTIVGERGTRLSGGQLQRIGVARALYHDPQVIVMDEATSSLDYKTEDLLIKSIRKLKGIKTIILISHRSNSLEFCDKIITFENGKIIRTDQKK